MPGSSGFSVTIAAVDAASAKIDAINKRIAAMRAPVERVQKAVAKFADVTGLNALGKGFGEIGRRSLDAFRSVSRIVEPLAAITSALSVAGMARLAFAWGEFGEKLSIASQRIDISTGRLQSLQGGARLAGASAEAMTSGLRTLGDTLTDAVAGRAPEAVVMMNTLGIAWRDATGHARSVTDVLPELADRIAAIKSPALQARVATAPLGAAGEQLLPYLRRGRQGMAEYAGEARHYGVINERAADVAEEFARQQHGRRCQCGVQIANIDPVTVGGQFDVRRIIPSTLAPATPKIRKSVRHGLDPVAGDGVETEGDRHRHGYAAC